MDVVSTGNDVAVTVLHILVAFSRERVPLRQRYVVCLQDGRLCEIVNEARVPRNATLLRDPAKKHDFVRGQGYAAHHSPLARYLILDQALDQLHLKNAHTCASHNIRGQRLDLIKRLLLLLRHLLEAEVVQLVRFLARVELVADE